MDIIKAEEYPVRAYFSMCFNYLNLSPITDSHPSHPISSHPLFPHQQVNIVPAPIFIRLQTGMGNK